MFFSLLLVLSQAAFVSAPADFAIQTASTPKCCGHCNSCESRPCCATKNDSESQRPAPAVPSVSRADLQLTAAVVVQLLSDTTTELDAIASSSSVRPSLAAPLYQRNCSYLI